MGITRKPASKSQIETFIKLSEHKNIPEEHYKVITSVYGGELPASTASFEISKLGDHKVPYISRADFQVNQMITEDPSKYQQMKDEEELKLTDSFISHIVKNFNSDVDNDEPIHASISYIMLKEIDQQVLNKLLSRDKSYEEKILKYIDHINNKYQLNTFKAI